MNFGLEHQDTIFKTRMQGIIKQEAHTSNERTARTLPALGYRTLCVYYNQPKHSC